MILGAGAPGSDASAQERPTARLTYETPALEGGGCPTETSFVNLVAARLGYVPFASDGRSQVAVRITREGQRLIARVELTGPSGGPSSAREIGSTAAECESLVTAVATAVSIALDPMSPARPPKPQGTSTPSLAEPSMPTTPRPSASTVSAPPPEPGPPAAGDAAPRKAPTAPPKAAAAPPKAPLATQERASPRPLRIYGIAAPVASLGLAPGPTIGLKLGAGLRVGAFSLWLDGRLDAVPVSVEVDSGDRLRAVFFGAGLAPCLHRDPWMACVAARFGALQGTAEGTVDLDLRSTFFSSLGITGAGDISLSSLVAIRGFVEIAGALVRTSLLVDGAPVWSAPFVHASAGVGLVVSFL